MKVSVNLQEMVLKLGVKKVAFKLLQCPYCGNEDVGHN